MRQTSYEMFGVECGEGWKGLYQPLLDLCQLYNIPVFQVKEKFGGLRFYTGKADSRIDDLIRAAEAESYHTCEDCGTSAIKAWDSENGPVYEVTTGTSRTSSWIRSLCSPCREKWDEWDASGDTL